MALVSFRRSKHLNPNCIGGILNHATQELVNRAYGLTLTTLLLENISFDTALFIKNT